MNKKGFPMRYILNHVVNLTVLVMLVSAFTALNAEERKVVLEKKFPVNSGERLTVDASSGDVIINTWDKNEVYVKILATSKASEKMEFEAEKTGYGVKVTVKRRGSFISKMFGWNNISVRLEIALPRNFNPDVSTAGGDVKVKAVNGEIKLKTSGGDVEVFESAGDMKVTTSGGDIDVNRFKGLSSVSTSGGDVKAVYTGENKGMSLSTTGGDIDLTLPSEVKAYIKLLTTGGDANCSLNVTRSVKISSSRFEAEINGGGEEIRCTTTGGDVSVRSR